MNTNDGRSLHEFEENSSEIRKEIDELSLDSKEMKKAHINESLLISYFNGLDQALLAEHYNKGVHFVNDLFMSMFKIKLPKESFHNKSIDEAFDLIRNQLVKEDHLPGYHNKKETVLLLPKRKRLKLRNGVILQMKYFPIIEEGVLVSRIWMFEDITIQNLSEFNMAQREEKYRGIVENMELGILEVDTQGVVVRAYDRFCAMTGYSQSELMGKNALEILVPNEQRYILEQQTNDRELGKASVYEVDIIKKSGEKISVLISGAPILDSEQNMIGTIGLHYDITDRKNSLIELRRAKLEAEAAKEAEKQFLANVSHEMRTPLNAILGMTNLLKSTKLNVEQREFIEMLDSSSNMLHSLITDILDISKIDAGEVKVNKESFDIIHELELIKRTFEVRMENKPVSLIFNKPLLDNFWIYGDLLLFKQIMNNLIGNACKFTKQGEVVVNLTLDQIENKEVRARLSVDDTGIGIHEDEQELIFEKFKQASNNSEKHYSGTGLGLVITKKLVELQGGDISLKSTLGIGSSFSVYIPYEISNKVKKKEQKLIDISQIDKSKVLIVEDNFLNQRYITTLMRKWKIDYCLAENGLVAIDACLKEKFDLILMDVNMPKMDGYEASRQILSNNGLNSSSPIVALTASGLKHTRAEAEKAGMCDFLLKPLHPEDLKKILVKYLSTKGKTKETMDEFQFDESLDVSYLNSIYEGDVEYSKDMFEIFFESSALEFDQITDYLNSDAYDEARNLVHKLKPSFSMVGLTQVGQMMDDLERMLNNRDQDDESKKLFEQVAAIYQRYEPVLRSDLDKMKTFLTTNN